MTKQSYGNAFDGFKDADPGDMSGSGKYLAVEGTHTVSIRAVRGNTSKQSDKFFLVVEFTIEASTNPDLHEGDQYSWVHNMKNHYFGAKNAKQFLAAALGDKPKSEAARALGQQDMIDAWSEDQPLTGERLQLVTFAKVTKNGDDFIVHNWEPLAVGDED